MLCCVIQARMGSSRLPGKVMMDVDEKNTLLHHIIQQLKLGKTPILQYYLVNRNN